MERSGDAVANPIYQSVRSSPHTQHHSATSHHTEQENTIQNRDRAGVVPPPNCDESTSSDSQYSPWTDEEEQEQATPESERKSGFKPPQGAELVRSEYRMVKRTRTTSGHESDSESETASDSDSSDAGETNNIQEHMADLSYNSEPCTPKKHDVDMSQGYLSEQRFSVSRSPDVELRRSAMEEVMRQQSFISQHSQGSSVARHVSEHDHITPQISSSNRLMIGTPSTAQRSERGPAIVTNSRDANKPAKRHSTWWTKVKEALMSPVSY